MVYEKHYDYFYSLDMLFFDLKFDQKIIKNGSGIKRYFIFFALNFEKIYEVF